MDKQTYYIKVGSGEILPEKTMAEYELVIQATPEDVRHLEKLFDQIDQEAWDGFLRSHLPFVHYHHDQVNDRYDQTLSSIYELIYKLGTKETKEHIHSMGMLQ